MMITTGQQNSFAAFQFLKECFELDASLSNGTETILKRLENETYTWLIAQNDDHMTGVLLYDEDFRIALLMVHPQYRRHNVASSLLDTLIDRAHAMHVSRITVTAYGQLAEWLKNKGFEAAEDTDGICSLEYLCGNHYIGTTINVIVDRPYGSLDQRGDGELTCNCGYADLPVTMEDCDDIDVLIVGVHVPLEAYTGVVVGVIYHKEDNRLHLIAAPQGWVVDREAIIQQIGMAEQYYDTKIVLCEKGR